MKKLTPLLQARSSVPPLIISGLTTETEMRLFLLQARTLEQKEIIKQKELEALQKAGANFKESQQKYQRQKY